MQMYHHAYRLPPRFRYRHRQDPVSLHHADCAGREPVCFCGAGRRGHHVGNPHGQKVFFLAPSGG
jgi:hypothetical protein